MIGSELRMCFVETEDTVGLVLTGGGIEGNNPETVGCTGAGDDHCVLLDDLDIVLSEKGNAVIIT
jgi:hypothetical protein